MFVYKKNLSGTPEEFWKRVMGCHAPVEHVRAPTGAEAETEPMGARSPPFQKKPLRNI
jgi:hypothetical protein